MEEWLERAGAQRCRHCHAATEKNDADIRRVAGYEFCWVCGQKWTRSHSIVCYPSATRDGAPNQTTVNDENAHRSCAKIPSTPSSAVVRDDEHTLCIAVRPNAFAVNLPAGNSSERARPLHEDEQRLGTIERFVASETVRVRLSEVLS